MENNILIHNGQIYFSKILVAEEMNKVWAKVGQGNDLSLCKKMWACTKKAGKLITKWIIQLIVMAGKVEYLQSNNEAKVPCS